MYLRHPVAAAEAATTSRSECVDAPLHHLADSHAAVVCDQGGRALAAEVGGVKLDDKAIGRRPGPRAQRRRASAPSAIFKVYVGSLYLPAKATDLAGVLAKGPRRVQMNLLRNLSGRSARRGARRRPEGEQHAAELAAVKAQTDELVAIMKAHRRRQGRQRRHARLRRRRDQGRLQRRRRRARSRAKRSTAR